MWLSQYAASREEEKMKRLLAVMALLAICTPALAADPASNVRPVAPGATVNRMNVDVNTVTGEVTVYNDGPDDRQGKVVSYDSFNGYPFRFFYGSSPGVLVFDDLGLDKQPGKDLLNRFDVYLYSYAPGDNVKIDIWGAVDPVYGIVPPNPANLVGSTGFFAIPGGIGALINVTITFDPPVAKPDLIWAGFQNQNGLAGPLINELPPAVGVGFFTGLGGGSYFGLAPSKDGPFVFGYAFNLPAPNPPGPDGDFAWRAWNSPEPTTAALCGLGILGFFRRRR
jgi:hypothetical protein